MPNDIVEKLEEAIRVEEQRTLARLKASHEADRSAEEKFLPVRQAAEEIRERLESVPSIEFTIRPAGVWITLADRDLVLSYDLGSDKFIGEESAHSWYDAERYSERYEWDTDKQCVDAMIRLCAKYVWLARVIRAAPA